MKINRNESSLYIVLNLLKVAQILEIIRKTYVFPYSCVRDSKHLVK